MKLAFEFGFEIIKKNLVMTNQTTKMCTYIFMLKNILQ